MCGGAHGRSDGLDWTLDLSHYTKKAQIDEEIPGLSSWRRSEEKIINVAIRHRKRCDMDQSFPWQLGWVMI